MSGLLAIDLIVKSSIYDDCISLSILLKCLSVYGITPCNIVGKSNAVGDSSVWGKKMCQYKKRTTQITSDRIIYDYDDYYFTYYFFERVNP